MPLKIINVKGVGWLNPRSLSIEEEECDSTDIHKPAVSFEGS